MGPQYETPLSQPAHFYTESGVSDRFLQNWRVAPNPLVGKEMGEMLSLLIVLVRSQNSCLHCPYI